MNLNNVLTRGNTKNVNEDGKDLEHPILITHDINKHIRDYASSSLYDFAPGIALPTFTGARFKME